MPARIPSPSLTQQGEIDAINALGATQVRAAILAVFTRRHDDDGPLALSDIAERAGVQHRQTAYRHVRVLEDLGFLVGNPEPARREAGRDRAVLWELAPDARRRLADAADSIAAILTGASAR